MVLVPITYQGRKFTASVIQVAITQIKIMKAKGLDGANTELMKHGGDSSGVTALSPSDRILEKSPHTIRA